MTRIERWRERLAWWMMPAGRAVASGKHEALCSDYALLRDDVSALASHVEFAALRLARPRGASRAAWAALRRHSRLFKASGRGERGW